MNSPRTQLLLLATVATMAAIASVAWWLSSTPQAVTRMAYAMVLFATGVCALQSWRRLPPGSPLALATTLLGLAIALLTR